MAAGGGRRANILVMTATITPRDSPELARTDPELRLADYADALHFYLGHLGGALDGIVFVENSDSDVSPLRALVADHHASDKVEFIANYGVHSYPGRDRSYGEFKILDRAMATSALIQAADQAAVIWKITGRYAVSNLARMVATAPAGFDFYGDLRTRPIQWADLRFMAWTRRGYDLLLRDLADTLGEDPREPVMFRYLKGRLGDPGLRIVPRYRREPLVAGVRGWDNRHYSTGGALLKYYVRAIARRIFPFVWI